MAKQFNIHTNPSNKMSIASQLKHTTPEILFGCFSIFLIILFYNRWSSTRKQIIKGFVRINFHDEVEKESNEGKKVKIQKFGYLHLFNHIYFYSFNPSLTTIDFENQKTLISELFNKDIVEFKRIRKFLIRGTFANWNIKLKPDLKKLLIGTDGSKKLFLHTEECSLFVFGRMRRGKTFLLSNCFLKQFERIYGANLEKIIITAKISDFKDGEALSYREELNFIDKLKEIENLIQEAEQNRQKLTKKYVIICDECQFLSKESSELIKSLIKISAVHGVVIICSTQSGKITDLQNIPISLMSVRISVGQTESEQFASSIFPPELAKRSYFNFIPKGWGYVRNSDCCSKVRFYYEI